jgi:hypothetical protein
MVIVLGVNMNISIAALTPEVKTCESIINAYLCAMIAQSQLYFPLGQQEFARQGRGAFCLSVDWSTIHNHIKRPVFYVPLTRIRTFDYEIGTQFVETYDPTKSVVVVVSLCISKSRARRKQHSGFLVASVINHDAYQQIDKKDMASFSGDLVLVSASSKKSVVHEILKQDKYCFVCKTHASSKLKTCRRCFSIKYCSRRCQKKDFQHHKQKCLELATVKSKSKAYL